MVFITRKTIEKTSSKQKRDSKSMHKVYSDKKIITVMSVHVKKKWGYGFLTSIKVKRTYNKEYKFSYAELSRLNLNDIEDMYLLKVQGKLHRLNYQRTLNLIKPKFYILGIDHKISYTTTRTEKGVVYLNKYDVKSLMLHEEVHKFCDDALLKVQDNLLQMLKENRLGHGNVKLESREWTKNYIKRSEARLEKIEKTLKHREQLRILEEYVGERPKTTDIRLFVMYVMKQCDIPHHLLRSSLSQLRADVITGSLTPSLD
ncbi:hypothetical protein Tco_1255068 [Tanacetum coccineum]